MLPAAWPYENIPDHCVRIIADSGRSWHCWLARLRQIKYRYVYGHVRRACPYYIHPKLATHPIATTDGRIEIIGNAGFESNRVMLPRSGDVPTADGRAAPYRGPIRRFRS